MLLSNRSPVSEAACVSFFAPSIPYSLNIRKRICQFWCGLEMAKFSRREGCDIYCTRLGRIFERLDRDEVDRETLKVVRAMRCRDFRDWPFDDDVDDRIRRRTLPVIKAWAGEYRDSNGSLCNPTLFAIGEERKRVLDYGSPPVSLYRTRTDASQLAGINQGLPIPGALSESYYTVATGL